MRIAYFDCFSGAAGDMILGALIDAGADQEAIRAGVAQLGLTGYTLNITKVNKQGFAASRVDVALADDIKQPHRHLADIERIIQPSDLPQSVKDESLAVFHKLAEAEAHVHGTTVDKVHFHEVGAVDAIVDIVGSCLARSILAIDKIICSPIPVGSGTVRCAHGIMPVPAPATAELLKGVPIAQTEETGELITPTGAALLTTWAECFGGLPALTVDTIGYGAGSRDGKTQPNVLRVMIGNATDAPSADQVILLETNLDDATPQTIAYCMEQLLTGGALDAYAVPIQMKKSRMGTMLCVLCEPARSVDLERIIFAETPTLGIRRRTVDRVVLQRKTEQVDTPFGPIAMKTAERAGVLTASPEYEDCKAAAMQHQQPLHVVMAAASRAWQAKNGDL